MKNFYPEISEFSIEEINEIYFEMERENAMLKSKQKSCDSNFFANCHWTKKGYEPTHFDIAFINILSPDCIIGLDSFRIAGFVEQLNFSRNGKFKFPKVSDKNAACKLVCFDESIKIELYKCYVFTVKYYINKNDENTLLVKQANEIIKPTTEQIEKAFIIPN